MSVRIGIVGLGAIGGAVAARLLEGGRLAGTLFLAAGSDARAAAIRSAGFSLGATQTIPAGDVQATLPKQGRGYGWILLCTRAEATEAALDAALPMLASDGAIVCLQNGLPEERVARRAGAERTLGAVIGWSATSDAPGQIAITGRGSFVLGAHDPAGKIHLDEARALLSGAFPTRLTGDLAGARWGKLALNCAISTLGAISGLSFGQLAANRDARALALVCIAEVDRVAKSRGVRLGRVSGLDPRWLADARGKSSLKQLLFWIASRQRPRQRSGMLERLLAGRSSGQIDDLNGAVVEAARSAGVEAPLNARLVERIHAIERGEAKIGPHHLRELASGI